MERRLRIGELAERTHVTPDVLRAWERRYGLLHPDRSEGGYRLYTSGDEQRVQSMIERLRAGIPAGEAARLVLGGDEPPGPVAGPWFPAASEELRVALDHFDEGRAQAALDVLIAGLSFDVVARDVILPYLRELGERWEHGDATVAQEHFASMVLRGRLLALARGWDRGFGTRALLACAPGEQHELGLIVFGLALRQQGWRVTYLGADSPIGTVREAVRELDPAAVVLVALMPDRLELVRKPLAKLARRSHLLLAGAGASAELAASVGAELLDRDPVETAAALAARAREALPG
jgi:MerR family transcriptional regulator, light-induced transcriptional regulator